MSENISSETDEKIFIGVDFETSKIAITTSERNDTVKQM
jgi:hypothetical protein